MHALVKENIVATTSNDDCQGHRASKYGRRDSSEYLSGKMSTLPGSQALYEHEVLGTGSIHATEHTYGQI